VKLTKSLLEDVTLVDVDMGRVILAQRFAGDFGGKNGGLQAVVRFRAQILYLAEVLRTVIGSL